MEVLLKVGCLPYAAGKQPSIHMINHGRKWTLSMTIFINYTDLGTMDIQFFVI